MPAQETQQIALLTSRPVQGTLLSAREQHPGENLERRTASQCAPAARSSHQLLSSTPYPNLSKRYSCRQSHTPTHSAQENLSVLCQGLRSMSTQTKSTLPTLNPGEMVHSFLTLCFLEMFLRS